MNLSDTKSFPREAAIPVKVNGLSLNALLDTGSSHSLIQEVKLRQLIVPIPPYSKCLTLASGQTIQCSEPVQLTVQISSALFKHPFLVTEIVDECILGLDFLQKFESKLDLANSVAKIDGVSEKFTNGQDPRKKTPVHLSLVREKVLCAPESRPKVVTFSAELDRSSPGGEVDSPPAISEKREVHTVVEDRSADTLAPQQKAGRRPQEVVVGEDTPGLSPFPSFEAIKCRHLGPVTSETNEVPSHLKELYSSSVKDLTSEEAEKVQQLLFRHLEIFSQGPNDLGSTELVKHHIETGQAQPIRGPVYPVPLAKRKEIDSMIEQMLQQGIIEESSSPWRSPVVLIKKADNSWRFCVDYRALNAVTVKDAYMLPRTDLTLESLSGSAWYTTLDMTSGYWQVALDEESKPKTAFSAGTELYQFVRMPFGLCGAPATFERLVENVLKGMTAEYVKVFLDDVLVHSGEFDRHLEHLDRVFTRIREAGFKLSPKKCKLFRRSTQFLGHIISEDGIATSPDKISAITQWPVPRNLKQLRGFLGFCGYYRRFIPQFSEIASPLHELTQKGRKYHWSARCQEAFETLKEKLTESPVLGYPREAGEFVLDTDASGEGLGAVLHQVQEGKEVVISYFSRALSPSERRYCVTKRELLAVVAALKHFHHYLFGQSFVIRTDHGSLKWLMNFRNPEGMIARWIQRLQEYEFRIEYRPGRLHSNADALSRRPCPDTCQQCERAQVMYDSAVTTAQSEVAACHCVNPLQEAVVPDESGSESQVSRMIRAADDGVVEPTGIAQAQDSDPEIARLKEWLTTSFAPTKEQLSPFSPAFKVYWSQRDSLVLQGGILYRKWYCPDGPVPRLQAIVPRVLRKEILTFLHDSLAGGAHLGFDKTFAKVRSKYYWSGYAADVRDWVLSCGKCNQRKGPRFRGQAPLQSYLVGSPGERVGVDILGPLPVSDSGNKYLLVMEDYFTKYPEVVPIPDQEAATVAEALVNVYVCRHGVPLSLHSDQGSNFESRLFSEMCTILGIQKTRTTPWHPQSNGLVENFNKTLARMISHFVSKNHRDWDAKVPLLLLSYRTAVHASTGYSPAELTYGRQLRLPLELQMELPPDVVVDSVTSFGSNLRDHLDSVHQFARSNLQLSHSKIKGNYDKRGNVNVLAVGDQVWLHQTTPGKRLAKKFLYRWEGPYTVLTQINEVLFEVQQSGRKSRIVHRDRLWRVRTRPPWSDDPATDAVLTPSGDRPDSAQDPPVPLLSQTGPDRAEESSSDSSPVPESRYPRRKRRPPVRYSCQELS